MTGTTGAREGGRLKPVLNRTEAVVHDRLIKTCEPHGSSVYPKMRVADVLPITASGIEDVEYSYALKSHFDFLVVDGRDIPLFAVEFDGPLHGDAKQVARDAMKDRLCKTFDLPLLRVKEAHLEVYRTYDLLSWIVEQWFLREAFDEAQQRGHIPYDEDFDPLAIVSMESGGPRFPMWLSLDAQLALQRLRTEGKVIDRVPSFTVSTDDRGAYHGLFWLRVTPSKLVVVTTGARAQAFPVSLLELVEQVGIIKVHDGVQQVLAGHRKAKAPQDLEQLLQRHKRLKLACAFGHGSGPPFDGSGGA